MRKLGNTLYVTLPDVYLSLDGEASLSCKMVRK